MKNTFKTREEKEKLLSLYLEGKLENNQLTEFLNFLQTKEGQGLLKQEMDNDGFSVTNIPLPGKQSDRIYKQINRQIEMVRSKILHGIFPDNRLDILI